MYTNLFGESQTRGNLEVSRGAKRLHSGRSAEQALQAPYLKAAAGRLSPSLGQVSAVTYKYLLGCFAAVTHRAYSQHHKQKALGIRERKVLQVGESESTL